MGCGQTPEEEPDLNESPTPSGRPGKRQSRRSRRLGFALIIASAVLWAAILAVPFLPVTAVWKVGIGGGVAVVAEVAFWLAAVILGREVVTRYRRYLDPRNWGEAKGTPDDAEAPPRNEHSGENPPETRKPGPHA